MKIYLDDRRGLMLKSFLSSTFAASAYVDVLEVVLAIQTFMWHHVDATVCIELVEEKI